MIILNFQNDLTLNNKKRYIDYDVSLKKFFFKVLYFFSLFLFSCTSFAGPFDTGDIELGDDLHNKNCTSCHDGMVPGGNGNEIYLSEFRTIKSSGKLRSQVEFCSNQNNIVWFEEEVESVSKYLNKNFYKFTH